MISRDKILNKDGRPIKDRGYIDEIASYILKYPKCEFLEIGTARGSLTFSCIENIINVGGHIDTIDFVGHVLESGKCGRSFKEKMDRSYIVQEIIQDFKLYNVVTTFLCGSNAFFSRNQKMYDVIFIDGDHCYEQGKKDIENSVKFLNKGGIIFLDDITDFTQGLGIEDNVKRAFEEFNIEGYVKTMSQVVNCLGIIKS